MGQPITVIEKASTSNPAILRLETNRPLSGMGHERYHSPPGELLQRPVDELARRLFAAGGVEGVHINGSVVTVTLRGGQTGAGLADIVRQLFLHYHDTPTDVVAVPLDEADATPEMLADTADAPSAQESADEAPAPDRPPAEESSPDQAIPGIPDAELEPESRPVPEREPSPADPADVEAALESAPPLSPAAGGRTAAGEGEPVVEPGPKGAGAGRVADAPEAVTTEPTPDVDRPEAEPLEADPNEVVSGDATVADPGAMPGERPDDTTSPRDDGRGLAGGGRVPPDRRARGVRA